MKQKPLHVPDLAWSAAQTLLEAWKDGAPTEHEYAEDIKRVLKDPGLKGTFKRLFRKLVLKEHWIALFDCVAGLRRTLFLRRTQNLRARIKNAKRQAKTIGENARELARGIAAYCHDADFLGTGRHSALWGIAELVRVACDREGSKGFLWLKEALSIRPLASFVPWSSEIPVLLQALAEAADQSSHEIYPPYGYLNRKGGRFVDPVRLFDADIKLRYAHILPKDFQVSDADLAKILTVLLAPDLPDGGWVSREAVNSARRNHPPKV